MGKKWLGQGSVEFALIVAVLVLILAVFLVVIQKQSANAGRERIQDQADKFSRIIRNEITKASESPGIYSREFHLPETINGLDYNITLHNASEIVIRVQDNDYVIFLDSNVRGSIQKGYNLIEKVGEGAKFNITITPV